MENRFAPLTKLEEKYRTLFNLMGEGFCIFELIYDDNGRAADLRFLESNRIFERETGLVNVTGKLGSELAANIEDYWFAAFEKAAQTGELQRLENYNRSTERWYEVSASGIGIPDGKTVCVVLKDITERKLAEETRTLMAEIRDQFTRLTTFDEIMQAVGEKIGTLMDIPYCHFMEVDEAHDEVIYLARWNAAEAVPLPDKVRLSEHITDDFRRLARAGETVVSNNTGTNPITKGEANAAIHAISFVTLPFIKNGEWKYQFSAHDVKPRDWRADEIHLIEEIAGQVFPLLERARAEQAMRESEEKYRSLFDLIDEGFCIIEMIYDEAGKPVDWLFLETNPAFDKNNSISNVTGKRITEMAPNIEPKWFEIYGRVAQTGIPERFDEWSEALNVWFDVYAFPIGEPEKRRLAVLFTDITAKKNIEREREKTLEAVQTERSRLAYIFENAPAFVAVLRTHEHIYETVNPMYLQLIGHRDVIGKTVREVLPDLAGQGYFELLDRVYETGEPYIGRESAVELQYQANSAPEKRIVDFVFQPIFEADRTVSGIFVHGVDITAQVEAKNSAETANRLKDEFLATLSHELRTPLNSILGWSQMLQNPSLGDNERKKALAVIERSARSQNQLIDDLLDVSRIITGKMRLDVRPIDLPGVIQAAVDSARPAAEAKSIRLQLLLDPQAGPVSGDPERLQQVVWNLLSNAVKFTPKGGRIQVRLERVESHIELTISDTGKGIDPDFLPHVFDRFRQSDGSFTRRHGGLGLGLAIVRQLVELHGGTISAASAGEDQGTTFTLVLPLLPIRSETNGDAARSHPLVKQTKRAADCPDELDALQILVVDDEEDSRGLLKTVLESCGALVTEADSVKNALQIFAETKFDIIISDIGMPEEDGFTLISKIREMPEQIGGKTPAIALTAYASADIRIQALRSGFQMHIPKPVDPSELIAVVANLTARLQKRDLIV